MPGDAGWTGRRVMINYTLEICAQCRLPFAADSTKPWLRKCTPCWKLGKGYVLGKADRDQQFLARVNDRAGWASVGSICRNSQSSPAERELM